MTAVCTEEACTGNVFARGWCSKHYHRWYRANGPTSRPEEVRFWSKVKVAPPDQCWLWTAARTSGGYGQFTKTEGYAKVPAHRYAYEALVGPIPEELQLDHLCRVHLCVNPAHLEPVTPRENSLRGIGIAAVNAAKTHCIHGHEFTPENTYLTKRNQRYCRTCARLSQRRRKASA